jgi:hypothetical protein
MQNDEIINSLNEIIIHDKGGTFWKIEKDCVKFCKSFKFALYLSDLISRYRYFADNKMLDDNMFFVKQKTIKEETLLSKYDQVQAFDFWNKKGVLIKKRKGIPAKNYYKINMLRYYEVVYPKLYNKKLKNLTSGSQIVSLQESKSLEIYYNNNNDNNNNDNKISFKDISLKENAIPQSGKAESQKPPLSFVKPDQNNFYDKTVVIEIFDFCNSFGKPLKKHRISNKNGNFTKLYEKSIQIISNLIKVEKPEDLMKSRKNFYEFLKSGSYKETHINPEFIIWNPVISDFFKPSKYIKNSYKKWNFPNIKSLYHEFKPGAKPEIKFAKLIPDEFPTITKILQDSLFRPSGLTTKDIKLLRLAGTKIGKMHDLLTKEKQWCYGMALEQSGFARRLIEFIKGHDWYRTKISPALMCSERLIFDDFYNWLFEEGIIKGKTEKSKKRRYDLYS